VSTYNCHHWSSDVNRETGNPVYRFQTGNRFAKHITGYRIYSLIFDDLPRIRNFACCIKIARLFKVSPQIKLTFIENILPIFGYRCMAPVRGLLLVYRRNVASADISRLVRFGQM